MPGRAPTCPSRLAGQACHGRTGTPGRASRASSAPAQCLTLGREGVVGRSRSAVDRLDCLRLPRLVGNAPGGTRPRSGGRRSWAADRGRPDHHESRGSVQPDRRRPSIQCEPPPVPLPTGIRGLFDRRNPDERRWVSRRLLKQILRRRTWRQPPNLPCAHQLRVLRRVAGQHGDGRKSAMWLKRIATPTRRFLQGDDRMVGMGSDPSPEAGGGPTRLLVWGDTVHPGHQSWLTVRYRSLGRSRVDGHTRSGCPTSAHLVWARATRSAGVSPRISFPPRRSSRRQGLL